VPRSTTARHSASVPVFQEASRTRAVGSSLAVLTSPCSSSSSPCRLLSLRRLHDLCKQIVPALVNVIRYKLSSLERQISMLELEYSHVLSIAFIPPELE
jgi:hypothetical protein